MAENRQRDASGDFQDEDGQRKKKKKVEASLDELSGMGEKTLASLKEAGIKTVADLLEAKLEGLMKIKGIGQKKAEKLIAEAKAKK